MSSSNDQRSSKRLNKQEGLEIITTDKVLYDLCEKAYRERGVSNTATLNEIQEWLNDNKDNKDLLQRAANYRDDCESTPLPRLVCAHPPPDLVARLILLAPDTLKLVDRHGWLPFHYAIRDKASLDIVKMLFEAYPKATQLQDVNGQLPLHLAMINKAALDVVKMLLEAYPEATQLQDKNGNSPLHLAISNKAALDVVKMLFEAYPEATWIQDEDGQLPLHFALSTNAAPDVVKMLFEAYPEATQLQDKDGYSPLLLAIRWNAAPDVVKMLLEAYPEAIRLQDKDGRLPLHIACSSAACLEVLHLLSKAYPASIDLLDHNNNKSSYYLRQRARKYVFYRGNYGHKDLLNNAVINGFSVYLVKLLLEALPEQCMTRDGNGMTLLHHACANAAAVDSLEVVMNLLEVNPETSTIVDNHGKTPSDLLQQVASQRNENGMYPLHHFAARGLLTVNFLRLLFKASPESIALPDNHGMLPFHHAALNNVSSLDVLTLFVTLYPESILFNF